MAVSFFVIEDHSLTNLGVRESLQNNTDFTCAGFAYTEAEAFEKLTELSLMGKLPSVIILDLFLGEDNGIDILREVSKHFPAVKIVVYSMYANPGIVSLALESGAKGFVSKSSSERELIRAIEKLAAGETYVQESLIAPLSTYKNLIASLTRAEMTVLNAVIERKTFEQISEETELPVTSVENYLKRIFAKTGCKNHEELIAQFG